ncbi:MAG TPA: hypothetical protein VGM07_04185 [Stellaceae bacterium]|jgi:TPR repeat protein
MNRFRRARRFRWLIGCGFATLLPIIAISSPADADAAAGRRAYDKGEYDRAMTEWQDGADHGDPDAEFGLGNLYEFGAGDLEQDYTRAAYWYRKAAGQGNTEAEYRLALIYAAGGDHFASNLVEAYKWASLAAQSQGVWGTLAADFKKLLLQVTSPAQQADGERLAAAWRDARAAEAANGAEKEARGAVAIAASPPSAPVGKPGKIGCPGWPFPTLPCTEQFPALAGAQGPPLRASPTPLKPAVSPPPAPPGSALDGLNQALARIDCAALRGSASAQGGAVISGTVANRAERTQLVLLAGRFFPAGEAQLSVDVVPPPLCRSLAEFNVMRLAGLAAEGGLGLRLYNGGAQLREGNPIEIEVRAPAYPVNLRIDYFALDGRVLHLTPGSGEPPPLVAAETTRLFGNPANGEDWQAGGAPFGTELITAVATAAPLDLGSRPRVEPAADYLRALKSALDRANAGADTPNRVALLLVKTSPR